MFNKNGICMYINIHPQPNRENDQTFPFLSFHFSRFLGNQTENEGNWIKIPQQNKLQRKRNLPGTLLETRWRACDMGFYFYFFWGGEVGGGSGEAPKESDFVALLHSPRRVYVLWCNRGFSLFLFSFWDIIIRLKSAKSLYFF